MTYQPSRPDGENLSLTAPISPTGRAEPGIDYEIPARQGRAVRLKAGERLTIVNVKGNQVCDFFAIAEESPHEFLSMEHCRTSLGRIYVKEGDRLVTNRRRALIEISEDTSPGVHDILIASCDHPRYVELGADGYHDNCADNYKMALLAIGEHARHVPAPFNIWMNIPVAADGSFTFEPPVSKAGDYV
ncbi:MAG: urea carboxylase-associated family protein, partial [Pseudomonadota bacterium]